MRKDIFAYSFEARLPFREAPEVIVPTPEQKLYLGWGYDFSRFTSPSEVLCAMVDLKELYEQGFKTFALLSVDDPRKAFGYFYALISFTNLVYFFESKSMPAPDLCFFVKTVLNETVRPIYFTDSLLMEAGMNREALPSFCLPPGSQWLV